MTDSRPLAVVQQAPEEGACCAACAASPPSTRSAPEPAPVARGRTPVSRAGDRRITFAGLGLAVLLLATAVASLLLPPVARRGLWLPLHLGLAGAAGTAVAAVLPFFTAALAVARPAHHAVRIAAIALVGAGAVAVSVGVAVSADTIAVTGGAAYLAGLVAVALAAFWPLRGALGPRRRLVEGAYLAAIAQICIGVAIATALLAGAGPVVERWAQLKPAHAWLNVLGFLSVIVAATLVHLAPTVAGTWIRPRRVAAVAVAGLAAGPPLVAAGFALALDPVARLGAVVELGGAVCLVAHAIGVARERTRWTSDLAWHRFTTASLTAAPVWLLVAVALAAVPVLSLGAVPAAWRIEPLAAPLAMGWLAQVLIGSWSHLLPAIGPGDMPVHARQRQLLGRHGWMRLIGLNAGVAAAVLGSLFQADALSIGGSIAALASVVSGLVLFGGAVLAERLAPDRPAPVRAGEGPGQPVATPGGG